LKTLDRGCRFNAGTRAPKRAFLRLRDRRKFGNLNMAAVAKLFSKER
jgi:hypothetical protein